MRAFEIPAASSSRVVYTNTLLFLVVILFWSSSWYAAKLQGANIEPYVSLVWRFGIATPIMFTWALLRRETMRFGWKTHLVLLATGVLMFSLNFAFAYQAVHLIPSGMVSVIFSASTIINTGLAAVMFRQPPSMRSLLGAAAGGAGLVLLFSEDAISAARRPDYWSGVMLAGAMTVSFCLGNMGSVWTQRLGVPVIAATAMSMAYGLAWSLGVALARGARFGLDMSSTYLGSLLFLAVFGTVLAFATYLRLLAKVGPARAAYVTVWLPVGALMISSQFEGFRWTPVAGLAIIMIASGNILVLTPGRSASYISKTPVNKA